MTAQVITTAIRVVVGTLVLGVLLLAFPERRALVLDLYLLFLGALVLLALVDGTGHGDRRPTPFERALRRKPSRAEHLLDLTPLEDRVALAITSAADLHFRLRPLLREIAAHRLSVRHGIELDAEPERARAALGADAWELVRPNREPPRDRHARGLRPAELRAVVETLERI
ncbi:MAG: hypothetical protein M3M94_01030 [Actinomycetota bacterium]|nr:hypothetical protein [Actinomycetota bacterium]